jgi:parallel beta-helix repeat protein
VHPLRQRLRRTVATAAALTTLLSLGAVAPAGARVDEACPTASVPRGGFTDVDPSGPHARTIDCLVWWGITSGQGGGRYGPDASITRGQMATMLGNVLTRTGRHPGTVPAAGFTDVPRTHAHARGIDVVVHVGVASGSGGRFRPDAPVSRDQMATMLVNLLQKSYGLTLAVGAPFTDTAGNVHEPAIRRLVGVGVTSGTGDGRYRPAGGVSRAQMASFVMRSVDRLVAAGRAASPATMPAATTTTTAPPTTTTTAPPAPAGRVVFVAPNGSDAAAGTLQRPFATLKHAHDRARPGDTIYLRGGVYPVGGQTWLTTSGTLADPIRIFAYGDERPVFDGSGLQQRSDRDYLLVLRANFNHLRGLDLRNGPARDPGGTGGIALSRAHFNTIERLRIHRNGQAGLVVWESSYNRIVHNDAHDNRDVTLGDADGFVVTDHSHHNTLVGNRSWRNSDDGFDMWNAPPVVLTGNWAFENGYDEHLRPLGDGNGFKLGRGGGGHVVRNNVAWRNRAFGFDENAGGPMTLEHNTAWANTEADYWFADRTTFRNNLAAGRARTPLGDVVSNSWTLPVTVSAADFESLDDTTARGPRAADGGLPHSGFLRLAEGSDLVDAGVDLGRPFAGRAPDLGAFERAG